MSYKITLIIDWNGENGKRERESATFENSPKSITIPRHGGEIQVAKIAPDTLGITLLANQKVRAFAIKLGSVLRLPLGEPLNRGSIEIHPEAAD